MTDKPTIPEAWAEAATQRASVWWEHNAKFEEWLRSDPHSEHAKYPCGGCVDHDHCTCKCYGCCSMHCAAHGYEPWNNWDEEEEL